MIKNDILIQRRGALSERINTSSRAIYFYCASVVRLEVERVSTSGPCLSRGACWSDTFSLDVSLWKRNVPRWDPHRWERLARVLNDSRAATLLITVTPLWNSENCQKKWKWQRLICSLPPGMQLYQQTSHQVHLGCISFPFSNNYASGFQQFHQNMNNLFGFFFQKSTFSVSHCFAQLGPSKKKSLIF